MVLKNINAMTEKEIYDYMLDNLEHNKRGKDKRGEVFTHPDLINKMLDLLPKSIWNQKFYKWLEPTAGLGFFSACVYLRLMKGLKSKIPNEKERSKHIIEKMLYMVELSKPNCNKCIEWFGKGANILCGDFLSEKVHFPNIKFHCIVGNPPFQEDFGLTDKGKRILGGKSKLYERIFLKSHSLLEENGYLSFIVPDNMFSGNTMETYRILLSDRVEFVSFSKDIINFFPKLYNISMCYFLLQKISTNDKKYNQKTIIESGNNDKFETILTDRPVNPVSNWTKKTEQLCEKYITNKRNIAVYNRGKKLADYKGNKYKLVYTPDKMLSTSDELLAIGLGIKKAILFLMSPELEFKMDYKGEYGLGPNTFYIPFTTMREGKMLEKFLKSEEYRMLALATRTSRQFLKLAFVEYLDLDQILLGKKSTITQKKRTLKKIVDKKTRSKRNNLTKYKWPTLLNQYLPNLHLEQ
jgi:hypothetical protein